MSIIRQFTMAHLKKNISRTILTLIGIVVSITLMTGLLVGLCSFLKFYGKTSEYETGNWHVKMTDLKPDQVEKLKTNGNVGELGFTESEDNNTEMVQFDGESKRAIFKGNEESFKQFITSSYEGSIPSHTGEIMADKSYVDSYHPDWKIGDVVTYKTTVGEVREKLVGIVNKNLPTNGSYTPIFRLVSFDNSSVRTVTFNLKELNRSAYDEIDRIAKDLGVDQDHYTVNKGILEGKLIIAKDSSVEQILVMFTFVLAVVIVASIVLIYNAFAMSLSEKVRYLGMLASVGATKAQKRGAIIFEGFIMGIIGIPIGILTGIGASYILFKRISSLMLDSSSLGLGSGISMDVVIYPWMIGAVALLGAITILISCIVPMIKASKITPIDAIRKQSEIKVNSRKLKSPKIIRAIFGYEGELANKNIKRNGRKSRVIIISMIISIVVFLTANGFLNEFKRQLRDYTNFPYQVTASVSYEDSESLKNDLKNMPGVEKVHIEKNLYFGYGSLADKFYSVDTFSKSDVLVNKKSNILNRTVMDLHFIDNDEFDELCKSNGIDPREYHTKRSDGKINLLLLNGVNHDTREKPVFNENVKGLEVYKNEDYKGKNEIKDYSDETYVVKDLIPYSNRYELNLDRNGYISAYVPFDMCVLYKDEQGVVRDNVSFNIETDNHENVVKALEARGNVYYNDIVENMRQITSTIALVNILMYTFIIMVAAIIIFNLINTLLTEMALRRQEFAMLKSVGITPGGFTSMIWFESIFYTLKALIPALPISALIQYFMLRSIDTKSEFYLNIPMYIAVSLVIFGIITISKFCAYKNTKKESIIETLKTDII